MRQIIITFLICLTTITVLTQTPTISIGDLENSIYCPVSKGLVVPFSTTGTFAADNLFFFKITDKLTGISFQLSAYVDSNTGKLVSQRLPENTPEGSDFEVVVCSTNPFITSNVSLKKLILIKAAPNVTATNNPVTINPGESTPLTFKLAQKYSYDVLIDFVTHEDLSGRFTTFKIPAGIDSIVYDIKPLHTTFYTSIFTVHADGCSQTTGVSNAIVMVDTSPKISATARTDYCRGTSIVLQMLLDGAFTPSSGFTILLSDSSGINNYQPIQVDYVSSKTIIGFIPNTYPEGKKYTAKISTSNPAYTSDAIGPFQINGTPNAKLTGSQTIARGDTATLRLDFTGNAPWKFYMNDFDIKNVYYANQTPYFIKVSPPFTTTYEVVALNSANTSCFVDFEDLLRIGRAIIEVVPKPPKDTTVDLSVKLRTSNSSPNLGDTINYRIVVANRGRNAATGISARIVFPNNVAFTDNLQNSIFPLNDMIWDVRDLAINDSVVITRTAVVTGHGLGIMELEIIKIDQNDSDSDPNNRNELEDDFDKVCNSVPIKICTGEAVELVAPSMYQNVEWYKEYEGMLGKNSNKITVSSPGQYFFIAANFWLRDGINFYYAVSVTDCCPKSICVPVSLLLLRNSK